MGGVVCITCKGYVERELHTLLSQEVSLDLYYAPLSLRLAG